MKNLLLILATCTMLASCSTPKYTYYFDRYPTKSITIQKKPNTSKPILKESLVASTSKDLFVQPNKAISLPKQDTKPYMLKTEANNIAIDTSSLPLAKDQVRIIKKDGSVIETKIMGRTATALFIEGGQIDFSEIDKVVLPIGGYNLELIQELDRKGISVDYREVDPEIQAIKRASQEPAKKGDKSKNKFAIGGWISFLLGILFLILSVEGFILILLGLLLLLLAILFFVGGLKSQYRTLSKVGLITMLILVLIGILASLVGGIA